MNYFIRKSKNRINSFQFTSLISCSKVNLMRKTVIQTRNYKTVFHDVINYEDKQKP